MSLDGADSADKDNLLKRILRESGDKDVMISGTAISVLISAIEEEKDKVRRQSLIDAFLQAKGFVVYRSSPKQKAALVSFVRTFCKGKTTLAIGDGANDVNMI